MDKLEILDEVRQVQQELYESDAAHAAIEQGLGIASVHIDLISEGAAPEKVQQAYELQINEKREELKGTPEIYHLLTELLTYKRAMQRYLKGY